MTLDPSFQAGTATRTAEYDGATYYFCSERCQRTFQASPQEYAGKAAAAHASPASTRSTKAAASPV